MRFSTSLGHFELLRNFAEIFESKGLPLSMTPVINEKIRIQEVCREGFLFLPCNN